MMTSAFTSGLRVDRRGSHGTRSSRAGSAPPSCRRGAPRSDGTSRTRASRARRRADSASSCDRTDAIFHCSVVWQSCTPSPAGRRCGTARRGRPRGSPRTSRGTPRYAAAAAPCVHVAVAAGARRARVRAGERPRRVIDLRLLPGVRRVAVRAAADLHLLVELRAVRVLVALRALLLRLLPARCAGARPDGSRCTASRRACRRACSRSARAARRRTSSARTRSSVWHAALAVVAGANSPLCLSAWHDVAPLECDLAIAHVLGLARRVTRARTRRLSCLPSSGYCVLSCDCAADRIREADPLDRRVALLALRCRTGASWTFAWQRRTSSPSTAACRCRDRDTSCTRPARGRSRATDRVAAALDRRVARLPALRVVALRARPSA